MEFGKVCLILLVSALAANALTWKNCDSNAPAKVTAFNLSPTPIRLRQGERVTVSGSAVLSGNPGVNYKVQLKIQKKAWFWITIPCISNVGSCTYTGISCQKIWEKLNKPAQCPVATGEHKLPSTTITIPDISLPSFLTSGKYWVRARLTDTDSNKQIACVEAHLKVA